jgi:hypothetical protein
MGAAFDQHPSFAHGKRPSQPSVSREAKGEGEGAAADCGGARRSQCSSGSVAVPSWYRPARFATRSQYPQVAEKRRSTDAHSRRDDKPSDRTSELAHNAAVWKSQLGFWLGIKRPRFFLGKLPRLSRLLPQDSAGSAHRPTDAMRADAAGLRYGNAPSHCSKCFCHPLSWSPGNSF